MATNPFADLIPQSPQQPRVGYIPGAPAAKTPPAQTEDQAEAVRLENELKRRAIAKADVVATDPKLVDAERTAAFLATRVAGSMGEIAAATKANPSAGGPSLIREGVRSIFGQAAANYLTGPERQKVEAAQADALDAALTLGTGAAYTVPQLEGYKQAYFPQLGDDESTIKSKQRKFRLLLQAAKVKAGSAAPKIDEALAAAGFDDTSTYEDDLTDAFQLPGVTPEVRLQVANQVAAQYQRPFDQEKGAQAAASSRPTKLVEDPSLGIQIRDSMANVAASVIEGPTGIFDAAAKGMGHLMAAPLDWMGFDSKAEELRNPPQIGEQIERAVPVPQDWNGYMVRQAGRLVSGAGAIPQSAVNSVVQRIAGGPKAPPPGMAAPVSNNRLLADSKALGIDPTMAAAGGPISRMATAATAQTIGGARPIVAGARRMVEQGGKALDRIAGREGQVLEREAMGEAGTRGSLQWRATSKSEIGKIYDTAQAESAGVRIMPHDAVSELDRHIAQLSEAPGGSQATAYLAELRDELTTRFPDGITVGGVRMMRTQLRDKFMKEGLQGSDVERRVGQVIGAISDDLFRQLSSQGKGEAARLFQEADRKWAERADLLDSVIIPIIGKKGEKSGEQVAAALEASARGNGKRFERFVNSIPKEDAGDIRATIINGIGRAKSGAQDAEGDVFSFSSFLTNWDKIGPTARKALVNEGDRKALDKLARIASRVKDASRYSNYSNTGSTLLTGATGAAMFANPLATAPFVAGSYALGRVLSSPGAARMLLKITSAKEPQAAKQAVGQLSGLAARNPAVANDILQLQDELLRSIASPATSAAAEEQK